TTSGDLPVRVRLPARWLTSRDLDHLATCTYYATTVEIVGGDAATVRNATWWVQHHYDEHRRVEHRAAAPPDTGPPTAAGSVWTDRRDLVHTIACNGRSCPGCARDPMKPPKTGVLPT
ncbi:MAG: hypothetical protein ACREX8_01440, partial [Gammaproteobacteria bacterium]